MRRPEEVQVVVDVGTALDVVGTELTPTHQTRDASLRLQGAVASVDDVVYVVLLVPKLLQGDIVERIHLKEVGTGCHGEGKNGYPSLAPYMMKCFIHKIDCLDH